MARKRILLGVIGRPHGVRGLVRVTSHTADPADLTAYGPLSDDNGRRFVLRWRSEGVAEVEQYVGGTGVKVADRTAAEKLTNTRLYADRAQLPEPEAEEFYVADLMGMTAIDATGRVLGQVVTVHDYGAGPSLEIVQDGEPPVLVPFTQACVPEVDASAGRLLVRLPHEVVEARNDDGEGGTAGTTRAPRSSAAWLRVTTPGSSVQVDVSSAAGGRGARG